MSTSEPIRIKSTVPEMNADLGSFSEALHGAAFVSSEGRAYRLFADDEFPSLGESFRTRQSGPSLQNDWDELLSWKSETSPMTIRGLSVVTTDDSFDDTLPTTLPIGEAIRRSRGVQGTLGQRTVRLDVQLLDTMPVAVRPRHQATASILKMRPKEPVSDDLQQGRPTLDLPLRILPMPSIGTDAELFDSLSRYSGDTHKDLSAEHWEIELFDTVFFEKTTEITTEIQTPAPPISLTHLVVPIKRQQQGFAPRRRPLRHRRVESEEVSEQPEASTQCVTLNEPVIEPERVVAEESVVTEIIISVVPEEEIREDVDLVAEKPRQVPFHWPSVIDGLKTKAAAVFQSLADRLVVQQERGRRRICFHSVSSGEGCSTLLLCAVRELTERGYHVLLVDANVHHPELPELFGVELPPDTVEQVTLIDGRLDLLSWGVDQSTYVGRLKEEYDFILMDGGSLTGNAPEEMTFFWRATYVDGVFLVINTKNDRPVNVEAVGRRLQQHGVEFLGAVENYVSRSKIKEP